MGQPTLAADSLTNSRAPRLVVSTPSANTSEREYALSVLLTDWFGLEFDVRPEAGNGVTTIRLENAESSISLDEELLLVPLNNRNPWLGGSVTWVPPGDVANPQKIVSPNRFPVLSGKSDGPVASQGESGIVIRGDLLGTVFALLSGFEEEFHQEDGHGRARLEDSRLFKDSLIEHPVVDELAELLRAAILALWPDTKIESRTSQICPTHDIDRLWAYAGGKPAASVVAGLVHARHGGVKAGLSAVRAARSTAKRGLSHDPFFSFGPLMDRAEEHGRICSFYFIPGKTFKARAPLGYYRIADERLKPVFQTIEQRGHTIGIHPSYNAHLNPQQLTSEVDALRAATAAAGIKLDSLGGRHHYLRWDATRSPALWERAGLDFDSSVGYSEAAGFRAGTSRPYHLWEAGRRRKTSVLERPLILMDATVTTNTGLAADDPSNLGLIERLKDRCRQFDGDFVFLVHNSRLADSGMQNFYNECLR